MLLFMNHCTRMPVDVVVVADDVAAVVVVQETGAPGAHHGSRAAKNRYLK